MSIENDREVLQRMAAKYAQDGEDSALNRLLCKKILEAAVQVFQTVEELLERRPPTISTVVSDEHRKEIQSSQFRSDVDHDMEVIREMVTRYAPRGCGSAEDLLCKRVLDNISQVFRWVEAWREENIGRKPPPPKSGWKKMWPQV